MFKSTVKISPPLTVMYRNSFVHISTQALSAIYTILCINFEELDDYILKLDSQTGTQNHKNISILLKQNHLMQMVNRSGMRQLPYQVACGKTSKVERQKHFTIRTSKNINLFFRFVLMYAEPTLLFKIAASNAKF